MIVDLDRITSIEDLVIDPENSEKRWRLSFSSSPSVHENLGNDPVFLLSLTSMLGIIDDFEGWQWRRGEEMIVFHKDGEEDIVWNLGY